MSGDTEERHVHVLHRSEVLCGFTAAPVAAWPEGHEWRGRQNLAEVNCKECLDLVQVLNRRLAQEELEARTART
jgi:hypothetical protein